MEEIKFPEPEAKSYYCDGCKAVVTINDIKTDEKIPACPYCDDAVVYLDPQPPVDNVKDRCDCDEWPDNMNELETLQLYATKKGIWKYTGTTMKFCPWCGKVLKDVAEGTSYF